MQLRDLWHSDLLPRFTQTWALVGLKSVLQFACAMSLGQLRPEHGEFIAGFRLPSRDKYATVRSGLVFLTMNEEASIVDYLDDLNGRVKAGVIVASAELCDACVLLLAYQYGFRRTQMARVRVEDVKIYDLADEDGPSVHVTFESLKQRWSARRHAMVRAIKREWAFMFEAFLSQRRAHPDKYVGANVVPGSLFGLSPADIAETIVRVTAAVTGVRRTANELRHTAAQRLVDAGASREELAEFMGHTSLDTGLVYFEASPTQAVLINKAMAVSPIYSAIVEVARTRTIDKAALLGLPPDRQIGGSPHGIPIAGIGACELGQSLCAKNPVLSCYGCRKFLPVADVTAHREVLDGLRPVVRQFYDASRGELQSPAYAQLARTLAAVQQVMKAVGGDPA
jgi:integrase